MKTNWQICSSEQSLCPHPPFKKKKVFLELIIQIQWTIDTCQQTTVFCYRMNHVNQQHMCDLCHRCLKWVLVECHWISTNSSVKSALTPWRVKRMMDCLRCSHILFVLKSCHFSLRHKYSAANVVLYIVHCACTDVPSKVRGQKTRNCYRVCQNYIMLSLCHYLFLFVCFCSLFVLIRHSGNIVYQSTSQKMLVSVFFCFLFFPELALILISVGFIYFFCYIFSIIFICLIFTVWPFWLFVHTLQLCECSGDTLLLLLLLLLRLI